MLNNNTVRDEYVQQQESCEVCHYPILPLITPLRTKSQALKLISSYNEFGTDYNPIQNESHRRKQWINKSRLLKI